MCMWPTMTTWKIKSRDKAALIYVCKVKLNDHDIQTNITIDVWKFWYFDFSNRYFNMLKSFEVWPYLAFFSPRCIFDWWNGKIGLKCTVPIRLEDPIRRYFSGLRVILGIFHWLLKDAAKIHLNKSEHFVFTTGRQDLPQSAHSKPSEQKTNTFHLHSSQRSLWSNSAWKK